MTTRPNVQFNNAFITSSTMKKMVELPFAFVELANDNIGHFLLDSPFFSNTSCHPQWAMLEHCGIFENLLFEDCILHLQENIQVKFS